MLRSWLPSFTFLLALTPGFAQSSNVTSRADVGPLTTCTGYNNKCWGASPRGSYMEFLKKDISTLGACCTACHIDQPKCKAFNWFGYKGALMTCALYDAVPPELDTHQDFYAGLPPTYEPPGWPTFKSLKALQADPWADYYRAVYGDLPTSFPIHTVNLWVLFDLELLKHKIQCPASVGTCPTADPPLGQRYNVNNDYQPREISWLWHPYPYPALAANTWAEVIHQEDPFGDEHFGMWFVFAPGSGIYFRLGTTMTFQEHQDAYTHFGIKSGHPNEDLCKAAAGKNIDSLQFLAHVDHVNYQCDTHNTGILGLKYMAMEIVGTKLVGTYSCGTPSGAPSSIRAGWEASRSCVCDNHNNFLNCQGVPVLSSELKRPDASDAVHI